MTDHDMVCHDSMTPQPKLARFTNNEDAVLMKMTPQPKLTHEITAAHL